MPTDSIVIVAAKRTSMGAMQGQLSSLSATELGSFAIKGAMNAAQISPDSITDVIMGCVLPAGLKQAPARQAAIKAGVGSSASCMTINKVCGSGLKAVMIGFDQIRLGESNIVIAGGMESMTNAPYLLLQGRAGYRFGHNKIYDHMTLDGLEDAYGQGLAMGVFAENTAEKYNFTRQMQDNFAIDSGKKALKAIEDNLFAEEICPVTIADRKDDIVIDSDEPPKRLMFDKVPNLKPAFRDGGTVTAANSSSITDGAAAVAMMTESYANEKGLRPLARICGHSTYSREPEWFTLAPVGAIEKLLSKLGWHKDEVDLFEINEAFAVVAMAAIYDLKLDPAKVNVNGGACALGHPIGASGARLLVTLIHALKQQNKKRGIVSLCIGGGEAVALAIEV